MLIAMMACLPLMGMAQNSWETENTQGQQVNPDQKYLVGAVPVVDGKVQFTKEISAPGKSAAQIYDIILKYFTQLTKEDNQLEQSRIVGKDSINHSVAGSYQEWLVFKNKQPNETKRRTTKHIANKYMHNNCVLFLSMISGNSGLHHILLWFSKPKGCFCSTFFRCSFR